MLKHSPHHVNGGDWLFFLFLLLMLFIRLHFRLRGDARFGAYCIVRGLSYKLKAFRSRFEAIPSLGILRAQRMASTAETSPSPRRDGVKTGLQGRMWGFGLKKHAQRSCAGHWRPRTKVLCRREAACHHKENCGCTNVMHRILAFLSSQATSSSHSGPPVSPPLAHTTLRWRCWCSGGYPWRATASGSYFIYGQSTHSAQGKNRLVILPLIPAQFGS